MLAPILMEAIGRLGLGIVLGGAVIAAFAGGPAMGVAFLAGGLLVGLSGMGLVGLASRLLAAPGTPGMSRGLAGTLMVLKLGAVLALAWSLLAVWHVDGLGFLFGMGAGVLSVVLGAQLGSSSAAGQAAIRAEEAQLAARDEEGGDSEDKSR